MASLTNAITQDFGNPTPIVRHRAGVESGYALSSPIVYFLSDSALCGDSSFLTRASSELWRCDIPNARLSRQTFTCDCDDVKMNLQLVSTKTLAKELDASSMSVPHWLQGATNHEAG